MKRYASIALASGVLALTALALAGCKNGGKSSGPAPEPKVMARAVPERMDDFVWENDLVCYRAYGEALEGETLSPGFDAWVKLPGALVADKRYKDDLENGRSYHKDWGDGKDCYKVGVSLGAGASAPIIENRFQFPTTNYRSYEILKSTPDTVVFVLHYPEWKGYDETFRLDKKITVVAGSYFCKAEDTYCFEGDFDQITISAGVVRHEIEQEMMESDRFAIWEAASDQSQEAEDGMLGFAVVMPDADITCLSKGDTHNVCNKTIRSGETVTYWFASCWSKGDIKTAEQWFELVKGFKGE